MQNKISIYVQFKALEKKNHKNKKGLGLAVAHSKTIPIK